MGFMHRLNTELTAAGELVGVEGLVAPGEAKVVRAGKNGVLPVTDGPFPDGHAPTPNQSLGRLQPPLEG